MITIVGENNVKTYVSAVRSSGRITLAHVPVANISLQHIQNQSDLIQVAEAAVGPMPIGAGRACHQNLPRRSVRG